jgi:transcription-repair coupling factor (superfamily II helicase)
MKGEPVEVPVELKLDVPVSAFLPDSYVPTEDLRLEAYRRLAEVKTQEEVDDVRREWLDRYGPVPKEAETLLAVGALRATCHGFGITEFTVAMNSAKVSPVDLRTSQQLRLTRLARGTFTGLAWREKEQQLVIPLPSTQRGKTPDGTQFVTQLRDLLNELLGD